MLTKLTLPTIEKVLDKATPEIMKAKDLDDALQKFAVLIVNSGFVRSAKITKNDQKYVFDLDGCLFADHIHNLLNPKDVTCPWAITAMSLARKFSGRDVKVAPSEITPSGMKTPIEFQ
jgi:hypothetical protein